MNLLSSSALFLLSCIANTNANEVVGSNGDVVSVPPHPSKNLRGLKSMGNPNIFEPEPEGECPSVTVHSSGALVTSTSTDNAVGYEVVELSDGYHLTMGFTGNYFRLWSGPKVLDIHAQTLDVYLDGVKSSPEFIRNIIMGTTDGPSTDGLR